MFGVQFVIDIGVKAAEAIISLVVCDVGAHGLCFCVYEVDHAGRHGIFLRVHDAAVYGAELGVILSASGGNQKKQSQKGHYT